MKLAISRKLLLLLASISTLVSCTQYQYATIISDTYRPDVHENVIENDSVLIRYIFIGQHCPITVSIFNKLKTPMYVDWSKSSVIMNGQRQSYWTDEAKINAQSASFNIQNNQKYATTYGNLRGTIVKDEKISFIPPNSGIVYSPTNIRQNCFDMPEGSGQKVKIGTVYGPVKGTSYTCSKEDSPLDFRSFLTISNDEQFTKPMYFDNAFWVTEYFETKAKPEDLANIFSNQFYNSKLTSGGVFFGGVFLGGVILTSILLAN